MPHPPYKTLLAQRLAVDPNALLNYFELNNFAIGTAPDGKQHCISFYELDHPKPTVGATPPARPSKEVAAVQLVNSKRIAKPKPKPKP